MKIEYFSIGSNFFENEDTGVFYFFNDKTALAILCDGMGGLSLGSKAANIVSSSIKEFVRGNYHKIKNKHQLLASALTCADIELHKASIKYRSNMGTTVAIALIDELNLFYTWQGNVRIYLSSNGHLKCLTRDHVLSIGYGNMALSRCLKGCGLRDDIPNMTHPIGIGDKLYVCSDGFYNSYEYLLLESCFDEIKSKVINPKDDASLIGIYF